MSGMMNGAGHDVVVVGASAGGIDALKELVSHLPSDLPAALFVVLHLSPVGTSVLPDILSRAGPLPAEHVAADVPIERGRIYVAPPDLHLEIHDSHVRAVAGPRENGTRPAVDPLFRSAAHAYGARTVGVVLSGTLDDGTLGLRAIKAHGGVALVQDPETAQNPGMPRSAIEHAAPDGIASPAALARLIVDLARDPIPNAHEGAQTMNDHSEDVARQTSENPQNGDHTGFTCPECGGAIWLQESGEVRSFVCRVDHKYTTEAFAAEQGRRVEAAVWAALRLVEERIVLMRNLAERYSDQRRTSTSFEAKADDLEEHAQALRSLIDGITRSDAAPTGTDG
jgi:two-component system, chemotaxis family, protein-glutamate methylesterase/glutaminase